MKKGTMERKLVLNRETLRRLAGEDLQKALGGAPPDTDETCFKSCLETCTC